MFYTGKDRIHDVLPFGNLRSVSRPSQPMGKGGRVNRRDKVREGEGERDDEQEQPQ